MARCFLEPGRAFTSASTAMTAARALLSRLSPASSARIYLPLQKSEMNVEWRPFMRIHRLLRNLALTIAAGLCSSIVFGQSVVNPLKTTSLAVMPGDRTLNATDNPVVVPMATGTNMKLFQAGNVIKIDSEYLSIMTVTVSP